MQRCALRETLTIEALTPTPDAQGGRSVTVTPVATVRAELVQAGSGGERLQAQQMGSSVAYRFRIRARADITPTMRATWTPRWPPFAPSLALEIHAVVQEPLTRSLLLECGVRQ